MTCAGSSPLNLTAPMRRTGTKSGTAHQHSRRLYAEDQSCGRPPSSTGFKYGAIFDAGLSLGREQPTAGRKNVNMRKILWTLIAFAVISSAKPVMTNQTIEAMLRGGVPTPTILTSIKTAENIQFFTSKEFYDRLVSAGASPSIADQIVQAMHDRTYKGAVRPEDVKPAVPVAVAFARPPVAQAAIAQPVRTSVPVTVQSLPAVVPTASNRMISLSHKPETDATNPAEPRPDSQRVAEARNQLPAEADGPATVNGSGSLGPPASNKQTSQTPIDAGAGAAHRPLADPKPRVFVSDSDSWSVAGGFSMSNGSGSGYVAGGARPQTVEIIKTFGQRCPTTVVTLDKAKADYIVLFDREGGKGYARKRDKIAVFRKGGDVLYAGSTRSLGNAVQDACSAIENQ
jgi:hypothetical protein